MSLSRREFLQMLAVASAAGFNLGCARDATSGTGSSMYDFEAFGNVSLLLLKTGYFLLYFFTFSIKRYIIFCHGKKNFTGGSVLVNYP